MAKIRDIISENYRPSADNIDIIITLEMYLDSYTPRGNNRYV